MNVTIMNDANTRSTLTAVVATASAATIILLLAYVASCLPPAQYPGSSDGSMTMPDGAPVTLRGACTNMLAVGCGSDPANCLLALGNEIEAGLVNVDLKCIQGAQSLLTMLDCPGIKECP